MTELFIGQTRARGKWALTRLVRLIFGVHQIATGREISHEDARKYFNDPHALTEVLRASGALNDPQKSQRIDELMARYRSDAPHGQGRSGCQATRR